MTDPTVAVSLPARWTAEAIDYLLDERACPRCARAVVENGSCPACGAEIDQESLAGLRAASAAAAIALRQRQTVVDRLRTAATPATGSAPAAGPTPWRAQPPAPGRPASVQSAGRLSVQSVLSVAGAGLIAIASLVFAFLSPDLSDAAARSAVLALVTALFLTAGWALRRAGLAFSAETVGMLGLLFAVVTASSASALVPDGPATRVLAGVVLLACSAAAIAGGRRVRLRSWVWGGAVGAALSPALILSALAGTEAAVTGSYAMGLSVAASGLVLHPLLSRLSPALGSPLRTERITVVVLQAGGAVVTALAVVVVQRFSADAVSIATLAALSVVCAGSARSAMPRIWSAAAGVFAVGAAVTVPLAVPPLAAGPWILPAAVLAGHAALLGIGRLPAVRGVDRAALIWASWTTARLTAVPAAYVVIPSLTRTDRAPASDDVTASVAAAIVALAIAALAGAVCGTTRPSTAIPDRVVASASLSLVVIIAATGWDIPEPVGSAAALLAGASLMFLAKRWAPLRAAGDAVLAGPVLAGHVLLVSAAATAFAADWSLLVVGVGAVGATVLASTLAPPRARLVYIAVGVLYAMVVLVSALVRLTGLDVTAALCVAVTAGVLAAFVATGSRRIGNADWIAFLGSAAAPFLVTVGLVLVERTAWTALPTSASVALSAVVLTERSRPVPVWLRCLAAALIVPGFAVIVVTLGAQVLPMSGSPITLPIIAALVAVAVASGERLAGILERRRVTHIPAIRLSGEAASLFTGMIAVLLAFARPAAGPGIAAVVLLLLGLGGIAMARIAHRGWGWWITGAAWTGALWSLLGLLGVPVLEAYLAPPALAALVVGIAASARGRRGLPLFAVGAGALVAPSLLALVLTGSATPSGPEGGAQPAIPWRTDLLLLSATVLWALPLALRRTRWSDGVRPLSPASAVAAMVAAAAGSVQAVRYGLGVDTAAIPAMLVILPVVAYSVPAAALAAGAGRELTRVAAGRAFFVPAIVLLVVGPLTANRSDPLPLVLLSVLAACLLAGMITTAVRGLRGPTRLPPVWVWFAAAWALAVAAWSTRELRVEAFSLPLGAALLAAGVIALRAPAPRPGAVATPTSWPGGFRSSWALLAPGLAVLLAPSVTATGTDPVTWRAVLVMAIALACILAGSLLRLAAPFVLGLIVLPIENVVVFTVQIGRSIEAMPWWITLAAAGAVLLALAVTAERRSSGPRSPLARIRDLR